MCLLTAYLSQMNFVSHNGCVNYIPRNDKHICDIIKGFQANLICLYMASTSLWGNLVTWAKSSFTAIQRILIVKYLKGGEPKYNSNLWNHLWKKKFDHGGVRPPRSSTVQNIIKYSITWKTMHFMKFYLHFLVPCLWKHINRHFVQ